MQLVIRHALCYPPSLPKLPSSTLCLKPIERSAWIALVTLLPLDRLNSGCG